MRSPWLSLASKCYRNLHRSHLQALSLHSVRKLQNSPFQQKPPSKLVTSNYHHSRDTPSSTAVSSSDDLIIPPPNSRPYRTLILCFDGTGDKFGADNSNVVQLFSMLVKNHPTQLVYYQAGIGTYNIPEIATPLMAKVSKIIDMMFGKHLDAHVMGGYAFLMQNYKAGDKICIFGFSRGAYTARALAGMVDNIGLIPTCNHQQVPFAYHMYSCSDERGSDSNGFKKAFSINVDIEFVGVWDTVNSVGLIPKTLPFSRSCDCIKYFRHALSLDERRVRFKPSTWQRPKGSSQKTDVKEVWFAGNHCDVGGGSVSNNKRHSLARIPLRWMIRECFKAEVGILFHRDAFQAIGMDPAKLHVHKWPAASPSTRSSLCSNEKDLTQHDPLTSEESEDAADAMCQAHDQLKKAWWWWILEYIPQPVFYQNDKDAHVMVQKINRGRGRYISCKHSPINIHRSVDIRMKLYSQNNKRYVPNAKVNIHGNEHIEWVD